MKFVLAIGALLIFTTPAAAQDLPQNGSLLMVSAEGEAEVQPDTMTISLGVTSTGATAEQALEANSSLMERILAAIDNAGTGIRSISTDISV